MQNSGAWMRERGAPLFGGFRLSPVMFHVKHRRHPQVLHRKSKAYTAGKSQDIHQVLPGYPQQFWRMIHNPEALAKERSTR
jgi:hypothetical protein